MKNTLAAALHQPTTMDEHLDSIHQADSPDVAIGRIKAIAANSNRLPAAQVLKILESALPREVRSNPQRRGVIQALKRAIAQAKKAAPDTKLPEAASLIVNTSIDDAKSSLRNMTPSPESITTLEAAIVHEETHSKRASLLMLMRSKLSKFKQELPGTGSSAKASATAEVTDAQPRNPAWDAARDTAAQLRTMGRLYLRGRTRLGMILAQLKQEHCRVGAGRPKKNSPDSGELIPWNELVQQETGYSRQSADVFIRLFEATKAKLKNSKKLAIPSAVKKDALVLFQSENPLSLTEAQWEIVDQVIASLTDGETEATLMQELGIIPKPKAMPKGGAEKNPSTSTQSTAGQLAFHFCEAFVAPLINARTSPDYEKMLMALPTTSTEEQPLSLATLEAEARALIADIERVKSSTIKPAKGRTIPALS